MFDLAELAHWSLYVKVFAGLFSMVDPVGAAPVFLSATADHSTADKRRVALSAAVTMAVTLALFTFAGEAILDLFGITLEAFQIAGGMLLLITALQLIAGRPDDQLITHAEPHLVGIAPLGVPLLAGPAAISSVIVLSHEKTAAAHDVMVTIVIAAMAILVYSLFVISPRLEQRLGSVALAAFTRVMGLIVAAIGVEFIVDGLGTHFPGLLA